jgi:organic radical activating enzyme
LNTLRYWDPLINWPTLDCEGCEVEAEFETPHGEGYIRGTLIKVDEIVDEGELKIPTGLPLWHIVTTGGEVCWHDVLRFRYI